MIRAEIFAAEWALEGKVNVLAAMLAFQDRFNFSDFLNTTETVHSCHLKTCFLRAASLIMFSCQNHI
jgi:hypothetical protein